MASQADLVSQIQSDLGESPAVSPDGTAVTDASAEETPPSGETGVSSQPSEETLAAFVASSGLQEAQAVQLLREAQRFTSPEGQAQWRQHLNNVVQRELEASKPTVFNEYLSAALKTPEGIQSLESMLRRVKGEPDPLADLDRLDDLDDSTKGVLKALTAKIAKLEGELRQAPQVMKQQADSEQARMMRQAQEYDGFLQTNKGRAERYQELLGEDLREAIQRDGARFQTPGAVAAEANRLLQKYERAAKAAGAPARPKAPLPAPRGSAQSLGPPQPKRPQSEDDWTKSIIEQMDSMGRG